MSISLYHYDSPEYKQAFEILLRSFIKDETGTWSILDRIIEQLPNRKVAVDWGAGTGHNTGRLKRRFEKVYAIEPNLQMHEEILAACPEAEIMAATLADSDIPEPVDFGIISHVLYHIPDHEWAGQIVHCLKQLGEHGKLWVLMKHPNSGCNQMIQDFGAQRFNLYSIVDQFQQKPEYTIHFQSVPGNIQTESLEETLTLARFMLSDRSSEAYSNLPDEKGFQEYVTNHFWDDQKQIGGWKIDELFAIIERNPCF